MTKKEQQEFKQLKMRCEVWLEKANEHRNQRKLLMQEKKELLKAIRDLEKKYE